MEHRKQKTSFGSIFLLLSLFISIGLVGAAENGGSMLNLLWIAPIAIVDLIIIEKEMY